MFGGMRPKTQQGGVLGCVSGNFLRDESASLEGGHYLEKQQFYDEPAQPRLGVKTRVLAEHLHVQRQAEEAAAAEAKRQLEDAQEKMAAQAALQAVAPQVVLDMIRIEEGDKMYALPIMRSEENIPSHQVCAIVSWQVHGSATCCGVRTGGRCRSTRGCCCRRCGCHPTPRGRNPTAPESRGTKEEGEGGETEAAPGSSAAEVRGQGHVAGGGTAHRSVGVGHGWPDVCQHRHGHRWHGR